MESCAMNADKYHLAELEVAEYDLAMAKNLIEKQKARMRRLAAGGGHVPPSSDELLRLLELSEELFEDNVISIKHKLEQERFLEADRGAPSEESMRSMPIASHFNDPRHWCRRAEE